MRHVLVPILVAVALSSCDNSAPEASREPVEVIQTQLTVSDAPEAPPAAPSVATEPAAEPIPAREVPAPEPDDAPPAPPLNLERLAEYFTEEEIAAISEYDRAFRAASTDVELRAVYEEMFVLAERLLDCSDGDAACREMTDIFTEMVRPVVEVPELGIPGLQPSSFAEAGAAFSIDTRAWRNQAVRTPSEADERFFDLLHDFHGGGPRTAVSHTSFRECYTPFEDCRTFYEPAYRYLGQGHYNRLLSQIDEYGAQSDAFSEVVARMRERLWISLIGSACVIGSSEADALQELEDVSRSVRLSDEERALLAEIISAGSVQSC